MANFPTPSQIQQAYFQILKSIKPSINKNDPNSDFVIRGNTISGIVSGIYGDQAQVDSDSFITSMRPTSLDLKGADLGLPRLPATTAISDQISITGTNGTVINPGDIIFLYSPTGILYTNTSGGTITGGILNLTATCQTVGQIGNVIAPDTLVVVSPPSGVNTTASVVKDFADGTNIETDDSYRARLLSREQNPPAGGNITDYPNFAFAADPSIRSAFAVRFISGLGTVAVYITTGTTDIDSAVTNGLAIDRIPNGSLLAKVQAYYDSHVPLTDCSTVYAPTEVPVNVNLTNVNLAPGFILTSVPSNATYNPLNLTVQQLIVREVGRPLYKYSVGGRALTGYTGGYIVASDIETSIYTWLSAVTDPVSGLPIGNIPILLDFQVAPLNSPNYNLPIAANQLSAPGTVTITQGN